MWIIYCLNVTYYLYLNLSAIIIKRKDWKVSKKQTQNKTKKFQLSPFFVHLACCGGVRSLHNVHRHSGGHCAKTRTPSGWLDRGDIVSSCMKYRGNCVESE
jgi:hypothetical protein